MIVSILAAQRRAAAVSEEPGFLDLFWRSAIEGRTPWLLLAYLVLVIAVLRVPAGRRPRTRVHASFVLAHVAMLAVAAGLEVAGYVSNPYQVAALAFELFGTIAIASTLAFRVVLPRIGLQLPRILIDIVTGVAVIVALIIVGKRAGFSVTGLITTSAVLTAVIGFAFQDTLGNMIGGIALQLDRSINVGDWINLGPGQPTGRVSEIRWRYTAVETVTWTTVIIPNSVLMKSQVTVLGRRQGEPQLWRRDVDFFVELGLAPGDVTDAVRKSLETRPVSKMSLYPPLQVLFYGFKDGLAWYRCRYWIEDLGADELTDALVRTRIYYALRRKGMALSIPVHMLRVTDLDAEHEQRKEDKELGRRMTALGKVDLFASLDAEERKALARSLRYAPFARGEAMTREGERDDGLYMIVEGEAAVMIGGGGEAREVAKLTAGQCFGEMSLMTGEARSATVVALSDVVTYRLDKPSFERLMKSRPEIAESVAEMLAERKLGLEAARGAIDEQGRQTKRASTKQDILGRIVGFFNIGER